MSKKPKVLPVDFENVPPSLQAVDRWLLWRYETNKDRWVKKPKRFDGGPCSVSTEDDLCSFEVAKNAYGSGRYCGVGLVLPEGIVGVDLDDCIDSRGLTAEAQMMAGMIHSYGEYSPSGVGLKFLTAGQLDRDLDKICHRRGVEMYDGSQTNRFFALTGHRLDSRNPEITGQRNSLYAIQHMITGPVKDPTLTEDFDADPERLANALKCLEHLDAFRASDYDSWIKVGMALRWVDPSDEMLDRWIEWSMQSDKFLDDDDCRRKWEGFTRTEGRLVTGAYLDRLARLDGYDPTRYQTGAITGAELCSKTIERTYVIEDFMVKGEPMIIGGASKTLKTTVALDMAVSIATGTDFMGRFKVPSPQKVMIISGESGESTLKDNLLQLAAQKGLAPESLHNIHIGFKLPKLDDVSQVQNLIRDLREREIVLVIIDPLYRSLRVGSEASNVYSMGERLELVAEQIHANGITPILLHHFRKQGQSYSEAPELEDLSQSGVAEFGRQFLLLKRRSAYQWDGNHQLYFNWGGSAGHQGALMLDAYTGTRELGLTWQTTLRTAAQIREENEENRAAEREIRNESERDRILEILATVGEANQTALKSEMRIRKERLIETLDEMVEANLIQFEKRGRSKIYSIAPEEG